MKQQLEKIRQEALDALGAVKSADELDALRVRFLGKKGELTGVLKMMGKLSAEERPVMGQVANNVRAAIEEQLEKTRASLKEKALEAKLRAESTSVCTFWRIFGRFSKNESASSAVMSSTSEIFLPL